MKNNGFTLIELLVVVLIIGILAAIALPQYKLSVGKVKFATLKNITKSISSSVNRYYMTHDTYPSSYKDLDLDFPSIDHDDGKIYVEGLDFCAYWADANQIAACYKTIYGKLVGYYVSYVGDRPKWCYTKSTDTTDVTNKICKQDTKKENGDCSSGYYCMYSY